jgi:hypothetical protein
MRNAPALLALLALLVMACTQTPPVSNSATPSGSSSCLLPISIVDAQGNLQGAFVSYPSGKVAIDASGAGGGYYDRAFSKWLPMNRNSVSPDGARYAYTERKVPGTPGQERLHLVEVSNGNDRLYELGSVGDLSAYVIVDFAPEGIWLSYAGYESPGAGLFLLDLTTGALKDVGGPWVVFEPVTGGPGVFWFTDGGPNPQVSIGMGSIVPARLQRFTIADGKTEIWFSKPGSYLKVLGTDLAAHPIFTSSAITGNGNDVWLALSPTQAKVIGLPQGDYQLITDSHGVWFGSRQGIYLYSAGGRLQKVSNQPGYPANGCF